jgi:hypothetical protein
VHAVQLKEAKEREEQLAEDLSENIATFLDNIENKNNKNDISESIATFLDNIENDTNLAQSEYVMFEAPKDDAKEQSNNNVNKHEPKEQDNNEMKDFTSAYNNLPLGTQLISWTDFTSLKARPKATFGTEQDINNESTAAAIMKEGPGVETAGGVNNMMALRGEPEQDMNLMALRGEPEEDMNLMALRPEPEEDMNLMALRPDGDMNGKSTLELLGGNEVITN